MSFYLTCFLSLFSNLVISQEYKVSLSCSVGNQEWEHIGTLLTCLNEDIKVDHPDTEIDELLDFYGQDISDISAIEGLEFKKTTVKFIPKGIKRVCPQLKALLFQNTGIVSVKIDDMKQFGDDLEYVSFRVNNIITLDANIFAVNFNLKFISFQSNKLRFIEPQFFENLRKLSKLKAVNLIDCTCINRYIEPFDLAKIDNKCNDSGAKENEKAIVDSLKENNSIYDFDVRMGN